MRMAEPSSGMIDTAGENCITRLDGAVGARRTTQSKTASANPIAVTELFASGGRRPLRFAVIQRHASKRWRISRRGG